MNKNKTILKIVYLQLKSRLNIQYNVRWRVDHNIPSWVEIKKNMSVKIRIRIRIDYADENRLILFSDCKGDSVTLNFGNYNEMEKQIIESFKK